MRIYRQESRARLVGDFPACGQAIGRLADRKPHRIKEMPTIYTIGHSNRTLDALVEMLAAHRVQTVADVRQFPGSRRLPHFNAEHLAAHLPGRRIEYRPFPQLGGRRKGRPDSINTGWRNAGFRAYADYMQTRPFEEGLDALLAHAAKHPTAIMCAEAVPWRCHRSLIADALIVRGWTVLDIMSPDKATEHKLTPFARVRGTEITYPATGAAEQPGLFE
jgi:uncharacterized protein (DUF488 family)